MTEAEIRAKFNAIKASLTKIEEEISVCKRILKGESPSLAPVFPELYGEMLLITDQGSYWQVKPRQFLSSSDFAEIANIVRVYNGEYVSAGKSSHFKIPKK